MEAAWHAGRTAGPLRAFFERISARRGDKIATVAVARKLVIIAWHLLTRSENYAYMRPALHAEKIRKLELAVGAPRQRGRKLAVRAFAPRMVRDAEHQQAVAQEAAYRRLTGNWQPARPATRADAGATPGHASSRPSKGKAARQATSP